MPAPGLPRLTIPAARAFAVLAAAMFIGDVLLQTRDHLTNGAGRPFGDDFINYWSGAFLAWHGRGAEIYDPLAFHAFQQSAAGAPLDGYHYSYPPVLLLLTAPLALVPYVPGLLMWLSAGWVAFYRALRSALPGGGAALLALATPAVFVNAVGGQNGTWTAALFGGGLGLLERRPWLAGGLLGVLIYKPQLGIFVPAALLAGRRWRAFVAAALSAAGLVAISVLCFGMDPWFDYVRNLAVLRQTVLEDGTGVWHRFVSVFVTARRLGAPVGAAYVVQILAAVLACLAVARVWFGNSSQRLKSAVLVLGTCLATPYLQDYDLVFSALAVAWLWGEPVSDGSERLLQISAGLLLLLPLFAASLARLTGLAFGPLFIAPLFIVALQMSERAGRRTPQYTGAVVPPPIMRP